MIKISSANKYYNRGRLNEIHVIDNLSLDLPNSGMVAIFGRSGCGKTTLLNAIGGLDSISSGKIEIDGETVNTNHDRLRNEHIGYIFQNYNLNKEKNIFDNVADALRLCGITDMSEITERVTAALKSVDMEKYRYRTPDTLSGGQQQRIAIARAIVKSPSVILADEPTGNLDELNTVMIMKLLKKISKTQLVVLVTHEANLVDIYCDKVIELVDGRISSVRENKFEEKQTYNHRNKNDIYLGELACRKGSVSGVKIEYYGDEAEDIELKIVNVDGKIYLQSNSPKLKLIDSGSEVKLKEGVFTESVEATVAQNEEKEGEEITALTPISGGKRFGRLFRFKDSFSLAWKSYYSSKKKKSNKLFRTALIVMAVFMVFMSASAAVAIRDYSNISEGFSPNCFYISASKLSESQVLHNEVGKSGIDFVSLFSSYYDDFSYNEYLYFSPNSFVTANMPTLETSGDYLPLSIAKEQKLLAGRYTEKNSKNEVLISSSLADNLIKSCGVEFIDEYKDLLGMKTNLYLYDNIELTVVGVVLSSEAAVYANDSYIIERIMSSEFYSDPSIYPFSQVMGTAGSAAYPEINNGEIIYISSTSVEEETVKKGSYVKILGVKYKVAEVVSEVEGSFDEGEYRSFVKKKTGEAPLSYEEYCNSFSDYYILYGEWFWNYYSYASEFLLEIESNGGVLSPTEWIVAHCNLPYALNLLINNDEYSYDMWAYVYKKAKGTYPLQNIYDGPDAIDVFIKENYHLIDELSSEYYDIYSMYYGEPVGYSGVIMTDSDYLKLTSSIGESDVQIEGLWYSKDDFSYYSQYMRIHSNDVKATEAFLEKNFGKDNVITPDEVFDDIFSYNKTSIIAGVVVLAVILGIVCVCTFFMMRASMMVRVKEIGIYRAIGVSKKNLIYRFFIEALLLTLTTVGVGFLLASIVVRFVCNTSLVSTMFFYPLWFAFALLVLVIGFVLISGILPILMLTAKTPSAILAKYDI